MLNIKLLSISVVSAATISGIIFFYMKGKYLDTWLNKRLEKGDYVSHKTLDDKIQLLEKDIALEKKGLEIEYLKASEQRDKRIFEKMDGIKEMVTNLNNRFYEFTNNVKRQIQAVEKG